MAKPSVGVSEVGVSAAPAQAACPCPGTLFPYPPPRGAGIAASVRRKCLQVELGAGAGGAWGALESMRASSPTHAKAAAALAAGVDVDDERAAWMARHPSALGKFEEIVAASEGKRIVVFLDYDGTLSPIVDDPDAAFMSETMRMAVRSVAKHFPTAIVSGRCRDKVFEFVKLAELYYAGSHGMDIKGPAKAASSRHAKAKVTTRSAAHLARPLPSGGWLWFTRLKAPLFGSPPIHDYFRAGEGRPVPAGERVPADDRGGARAPGRGDALHPRSQGGEQQVLRVRPLQMRRRKDVGRAVGGGEGRASGLPEAAADAGADGAGGAAGHQVGQGQGARVPARVAGLGRMRQRPARLHRRRPHRRGRLQGPAAARAGRGHPRVQAPQGDGRLLLAPGARRGHGLPAAPRRVEAALQGEPQAQAPAMTTLLRSCTL
ncbi:uncharacterized protein LOC120677864 isoform X1 [Panicum virgatum]|uniref:uncharacterized protein LOC120677864 isoform X1 n=1 Tax=Panicum virgatum TaxID=38727 RepID=UPI0019D580DF|nr:uncharacterized protein LOC120677864 isoform X1 [Panicum virgatum]